MITALHVPDISESAAATLYRSIVEQRQKRLRESQFKQIGTFMIPVLNWGVAAEEQLLAEAMGTTHGLTLSGFLEAIVHLALSLERYKERPFTLNTCKIRVMGALSQYVGPLAEKLSVVDLRRPMTALMEQAIIAQATAERRDLKRAVSSLRNRSKVHSAAAHLRRKTELQDAVLELRHASRAIFGALHIWQPTTIDGRLGGLEMGQGGVRGMSLPRFVQMATLLLADAALTPQRAAAAFILSAPWASIYQLRRGVKLLQRVAFEDAIVRLAIISANAARLGPKEQQNAKLESLLRIPAIIEPAHFVAMAKKLRGAERAALELALHADFVEHALWYRW